MQGADHKYITFRQETLGEKKYLESPRIHRRIILKWLLVLRKPTHTSKDNIKMAFKYYVDCLITVRKLSGGEGTRDYQYMGCDVT